MTQLIVQFALLLIILVSTSLSSTQVFAFSFIDIESNIYNNPTLENDFLTTEHGKNLKDIKVNNINLNLSFGVNKNWSDQHQTEFQKIRNLANSEISYPIQYSVINLINKKIIEESLEANRKFFGASVSKLFVAATRLNQIWQNPSSLDLQLLSDMIVVSSNSAWSQLQKRIGNGNDRQGQVNIHEFTQSMGYERTRGFKGYLDKMHGNELTTHELALFLSDTYLENYRGASTLWKLMHTSRTGANRGKLYLPKSLPIGGKTGTYEGTTVDPESGSSKFPDGSPYRVNVKHHVLVFWHNDIQYGIVVLANNGRDESSALLAGGFYRIILQDQLLN